MALFDEISANDSFEFSDFRLELIIALAKCNYSCAVLINHGSDFSLMSNALELVVEDSDPVSWMAINCHSFPEDTSYEHTWDSF